MKSKLMHIITPLFIIAAYYVVGIIITSLWGDEPMLTTIFTDWIFIGVLGIWLGVHSHWQSFKRSVTGLPMKYMSLILLVLVWIFGQITATWLFEIVDDVNFVVYSSTMNDYSAWLALLLMLITAPLCEEFLLRGILYTSWSHINGWFALIGSSIVFALMHGTIVHLPVTFMAGLVFALIYECTHNVFVCALFHGLYNMGVVVFANSSFPSFLFQPEVFLLVDVLLILFIFVEYKHAQRGNVVEVREVVLEQYGYAKEAKEESDFSRTFGEDARGSEASIEESTTDGTD